MANEVITLENLTKYKELSDAKYVPYTGATQNLNLGTKSIQFTTSLSGGFKKSDGTSIYLWSATTDNYTAGLYLSNYSLNDNIKNYKLTDNTDMSQYLLASNAFVGDLHTKGYVSSTAIESSDNIKNLSNDDLYNVMVKHLPVTINNDYCIFQRDDGNYIYYVTTKIIDNLVRTRVIQLNISTGTISFLTSMKVGAIVYEDLQATAYQASSLQRFSVVTLFGYKENIGQPNATCITFVPALVGSTYDSATLFRCVANGWEYTVRIWKDGSLIKWQSDTDYGSNYNFIVTRIVGEY